MLARVRSHRLHLDQHVTGPSLILNLIVNLVAGPANLVALLAWLLWEKAWYYSAVVSVSSAFIGIASAVQGPSWMAALEAFCTVVWAWQAWTDWKNRDKRRRRRATAWLGHKGRAALAKLKRNMPRVTVPRLRPVPA